LLASPATSDAGIDWNVVFLLLGMMLIVAVLQRTGFFEYLAIWAAKRARGRPFRVMVILVVVTALASAVLDNVTTVLLIAPVTFWCASGSTSRWPLPDRRGPVVEHRRHCHPGR
jgi:Na+/H+ antiporter NhaD/arsenite permease-like protein